ncbi:hypothetical protein SporoP8_01885 [Sporosarcina ureae]|uniref:DUF3221 domain-containing protein n=1 Tax=Sporosarcina ureae TaxID=1571 RepID=UPI000A161C41|nr:DUF3221 domain-containing protein [Sporosarcina ureae]ARJ37742.1 hypothetical protein SporoP8_01885 [Sporosarcina ureae]
MKKLLTLFVVAGCGKDQANNMEDKRSSLEKQEGIIVDIRATEDGRSQILVVPNISEDDISDKNDDELIKIAQEKDGAYYGFETGKYEELEVGAHVIVYWNGNQADSDPPQRGIEKVDIITK